MTTSEDEKAADRYWNKHEFIGDIVTGPEVINFPASAHVVMPAEEYKQQIGKAFLAGIEYGRKYPTNTKEVANEIHLYDPKGSLKIVDVYADRDQPSKVESVPDR